MKNSWTAPYIDIEERAGQQVSISMYGASSFGRNRNADISFDTETGHLKVSYTRHNKDYLCKESEWGNKPMEFSTKEAAEEFISDYEHKQDDIFQLQKTTLFGLIKLKKVWAIKNANYYRRIGSRVNVEFYLKDTLRVEDNRN